MHDSKQKGIIFNVQKFSVHDGMGIRTIVFLKGCPLRCRWCSNPESQHFQPERAFNPQRCLTAQVCGRCSRACPSGAMSVIDGLNCYNPKLCQSCGSCVRACPSGAQIFYGYEATVEDLVRKVEEDDVFYARSGGGMTLSGGEALAQPDFALALLREARRHRLKTAIETCGCYPGGVLQEAVHHLDELIFDIKCLDPVKHREYTGGDNRQILANISWVFENCSDLPILIRTPVIPGFNDTEEEIMGIREMIPFRPNIRYEVLTYHRMGMPKYANLGRPYLLGDVKADEGFMRHIRARLDAYMHADTIANPYL